MTSQDVLTALAAYRRRGWLPTPLDGKNPAIGGAGWQTRDHADEEFGPGVNVGIILARGLIDIDLDAPEARRAAPYLLPPTRARFGRPSTPTAHWLYHSQGGLATAQFSDPMMVQPESKRMLVELRSGDSTHQTMFPPSVHPATGERLVWVDDGDPADVNSSELIASVKKLAAAALLGRYWPKNQRHLAALALAGGLARAGWGEDATTHFLGAVAVAAQDEEERDRIRAAQDTLRRLFRGEPTTGWTTLGKLLGEKVEVVRKVMEWLDLTQDQLQMSARCDNNSAPIGTGKFAAPSIELITVWGHEVSEEAVIYAWKPYLPAGKLVHFAGNSSQAKSPVTIDIAARFSTGAPWPDGSPNRLGPKSVIVLNVEDDLADTILPRFRVAGGEKTKLCFVKGTKVTCSEDGSHVERGLALDRDFSLLAEKARSISDLGLIVIDPITNYLGGAKMNAEEEVRAVLTPLANVAASLGVVIITVGHFNRREKGTDPLHRLMGAAAFSGVARAVYAFGPDPEDDSKFAHVMTTVRGTGGEGMALRYRTEMITETCPDCPAMDIIKVVWVGASNATAEDSVDPAPAREKSQETAAAEVLKEFLRDGRKPARDCEEHLRSEGYDLQKLNPHRIRKIAGAQSKKFTGDGFYSWYIEVTCTPLP